MKTVLDTLDGLSDELKAEYSEKDGKFHLKLEGSVPGSVAPGELASANQKIVEFRNKNIELMKENDELRPLKDRFAGIDPTEARQAMEKVKALGKEGIRDADDLAKKIKDEAEALIKPLRDQLAQSAAETAAAQKRADDSLFDATITEQFSKLQGKAQARSFVVNLAKEDFEVKDGKVVAKAGKFSTKTPGDPLTPEEWLTSKVQKDHDYVFQPSNGGGTPPAKPGTTVNKPANRDGVKILKNPTPQQLGEFATEIAQGKMRIEHEVAS
jgi:hypothetical protein